MLKRWLNGHVTHVVTGVLITVLSAAAIGSWTMVWRINTWMEQMEGEHARYEQTHTMHNARIDTMRRRVRWLERQRNTSSAAWSRYE